MTPRNENRYNNDDTSDDEEYNAILKQKQQHAKQNSSSSPVHKRQPSPKKKSGGSPSRHGHHHRHADSKKSSSKKSPKSKKSHRSVRFDQAVIDTHHQQQQNKTSATAVAASASSSSSSQDKNEAITIKTSQTQSSWELTWPIWHMLPRNERKTIASSYGYKSIGEFEEYMTLEKAVGVSEEAQGGDMGKGDGPYENEVLYQEEARPGNYGLGTVARKQQQQDDDESSSDEEDDGDTLTTTPTAENSTLATSNDNNDPFLLLPEEILTLHIFPYLDIDYYSILSLISPSWKSFTRTEFIYKQLCQRCYLNQSKKKALHVHRFQGSYRKMLEERPRVKTGGGLYVLKYGEVVKIQRDMWTEIPVGAVLENVYYRYMYFHENSRVLYSLTHIPPHEMIPKLLHMKSTGEPVKSTVWGNYEVRGCDVTVWASHPWHDVRMEMKLLREGVDGAKGRFCAMTFEKHMSSVSGNFDEYCSPDLVEYKVPNEYFRFLRDWRL